jgi:hypothetical protein
MTYIAESWNEGDILVQLNDKLQDCLSFLTEATPKENGLVLEAPANNQKATAVPKNKTKNKKNNTC